MNAVKPVDQVTTRILSAAYRVSNALGSGFLEKAYENALALELRALGVPFEQQRALHVRYRSEIVGEYIPDLLVAERVIVEIKALDALNRIHEAQCINYLRASGMTRALLLNFGRPRLEVKRLVWNY